METSPPWSVGLKFLMRWKNESGPTSLVPVGPTIRGGCCTAPDLPPICLPSLELGPLFAQHVDGLERQPHLLEQLGRDRDRDQRPGVEVVGSLHELLVMELVADHAPRTPP